MSHTRYAEACERAAKVMVNHYCDCSSCVAKAADLRTLAQALREGFAPEGLWNYQPGWFIITLPTETSA